MTTRFYYEDGQGRMIGEQGNDAMDYVEEVTLFHLKTLTRIREYCEKQDDEQLPFQEEPKNLDVDMEDVISTVKKQAKSYRNYSNDQKLLFVYYNKIKLFNAAKSGRLSGGINDRTAQKWAKKLKEDKDWNILEKQTNLINRPKQQLDDRHKLHLLNFYKFCLHIRCTPLNNPILAILNFSWTISSSWLSCQLFEGKITFSFQKVMDSALLHTKVREFLCEEAHRINYSCLWVVVVVAMELRNPQEETSKRIKIDLSNRKRKAPAQKKKSTSKGTVTGHYFKSLEKAMDEMDHFPELKGYYIFWPIVKNKVKRSSFEATEDLATRIAEACNDVPPKHLQAFVQNSIDCFEICFRGEPL
ncbi:hypothetical protein G6F56_001537 [Rhizopus delemar]|nr:hypothetical protein G6F56_001537 [Rhizopus delemar]